MFGTDGGAEGDTAGDGLVEELQAASITQLAKSIRATA